MSILDRWIESLQILAGENDNPGAEERAEMADVRRKMLDTGRAEVLAEAAAFVGNDDDCGCGGCDTCYARHLAAGLLAMAGEKATASAAKATPDFFQPGHTYSEPGDITDWKFRVDHITTHPEDGERTALGWRHFRGAWEPYAYGEGDFEIHQIADRIGTTTEDSK